MSAGFTPGPWQRSGVRVKLGEHDCLAVGPDSFSIAFLPIGRRPNEQAGAIANARLIAAAPELYEAVKTLMIAADHAGGLGGCDPELEAACRVGSAALAKATPLANAGVVS